MTFEDEKMNRCLGTLRSMEKRCNSELSWSPSMASISGMKSRMVRGIWGNGESNVGMHEEEGRLAALRLEQQIILADCQVLAAIINFLQQDWGAYVKGGWVLRKAWKIYQKAYGQIRSLYLKRVGLQGNLLAPPPPPHLPSVQTTTTPQTHHPRESPSSTGSSPLSGNDSSSEGSESSPFPGPPNSKRNGGGFTHSFSVPLNLFSLIKNGPIADSSPNGKSPSDITTSSATARHLELIDVQNIKRLMSAVSFGFGLFHLAVSLLPPKLLNVIHFLGFEGDRQTGIQALHFTRQGSDMRGPLATLALLWFHTIVRPFFGLDGANLRSGADAAQRLIDSSKADFSTSALFLFFQGRVDRLKSNFPAALRSYEHALSVSSQREVRLLCLHEVGWSYILMLSWERSSEAFLQLKKESRWSKGFYSYLSSVCLGASGNVDRALELAEETPDLVHKPPNNQLEKFLYRRANKILTDIDDVDKNYFRLLGYELLYLWNALGACLRQHSHATIQTDCEKIDVPALEGVRQLILGSLFSDSRQASKAKICFGKAIKDGELVKEYHTSAFAAYELGMVLSKNPSTRAEGRSYLEFARDNYKNYDFENRLNVRIHSALRHFNFDGGVPPSPLPPVNECKT
ncbi:tetratricopeptide repeat protein 39C isoform X2 [Lepeophtheirus salmonis]|nr:tetratricopeptide repeat protein 39C-like isoform X2 [Lepeophtheirus salmonis]